jgi:hypothetical protein
MLPELMSGESRESTGLAGESAPAVCTVRRTVADPKLSAVASEVTALYEQSSQNSRSHGRRRGERVWRRLLALLADRAA